MCLHIILLMRPIDICPLITLSRLEKDRILIVVVICPSSANQVYFSVFSHDKKKKIRAIVAD